MREYTMGRGEYLEERVPDLKALVEEYFGPVTSTVERDGHELYNVENPTNPVFDHILAGAGKYEGKKDTLLVHFEERPAQEILNEGHLEAAEEAVQLKNDFLYETTGRDAKSRRESLKRAVEDDTSPDL